MSVVSAESQFISPFLQLLSLSGQPSIYTDTFQQDLSKIQSLGPSLPKLSTDAKKPKLSKSTEDDKVVNLTIKSIKPPKFNQIISASTSTTIYTIKEQLIAEAEELAGTQVEQLKFLIKGKVIADSTVLDALATDTNKLSFMCMIGKPTTGLVPAAETVAHEEPELIVEETVTSLTEDQWMAIHATVLKSYSVNQADAVVLRLKLGWELAK
ncbi:hypothetical protein BABINDRAFT_163826 [Babjeviella inositovora NRRL Y-12698]|uniref:Ubiquitin-like domain-containing protein n=1 Tax=Babjeviella inositovora NRRL Y-12698 TaxID=984486 RepID=A0A1E3QHA6_9ASCO|nr:uncharacterized protein BABINDRAFT_163826 [Babjeviella inositovora NRRL Y-12698]ODQ77093.1 hypothetical protein BABINDRAFT_163826 [Babjeviella inositovora NRRL Y-12698]